RRRRAADPGAASNQRAEQDPRPRYSSSVRNIGSGPAKEVVMSRNIPGPAAATSRSVPGPNGRLHVTDQPGEGPPLVLLHGFPDDSRIYDRLIPLLTPRRVLALDWLGYGPSGRAAPGPFDPRDHERSIGAVLDSLELAQAVLVGHDASGPMPSTSRSPSPAGWRT